jgi:hypothetical protein
LPGPTDVGDEHEGDVLKHVSVGGTRPAGAGVDARATRWDQRSTSAHDSSLISRGGGEDTDEDMPGTLRQPARTGQRPKPYFRNVFSCATERIASHSVAWSGRDSATSRTARSATPADIHVVPQPLLSTAPAVVRVTAGID